MKATARKRNWTGSLPSTLAFKLEHREEENVIDGGGRSAGTLGCMNKATEVFKQLIGREREMGLLKEAWDSVRKGGGPRLVMLLADSGYGKTRLIHEFYREISKEENAARGGAGYWPDCLNPDPSNLLINPVFDKSHTPTGDIPWLWWGLRWSPSTSRNAQHSECCPIVDNKREFAPHYFALLAKRQLAGQARKLGVALADFLTDVVQDLSGVGMAKSAWDLCCAMKKTAAITVESRQDHGIHLTAELGKEKPKLLNEAAECVMEFFKSEPALPVILVLDDAQWADPLTLEFCLHMMRQSSANKYPLLILATHWEMEWKQNEKHANEIKDLDKPQSMRQLVGILEKTFGEMVSRIGGIPVGKIDLKKLISDAYPRLQEEHRRWILEKSDGNPLVLHEFFTLIKDSPQWLDGEGRLDDQWVEDFQSSTVNAETRAKTRLATIYRSDREIVEFLKLGAFQGVRFFDKLVEEVAAEMLKSVAYPEVAKRAENPHCVISRLEEGQSRSEFRHVIYRDAAQKYVGKDEKTLLPRCFLQVIARWQREGKIQGGSHARELAELAMRLLHEAQLSKEDETAIASVLSLGAEHVYSLGFFASAEPLFRRALEARERTLGPEHPDTLGSLNNLALLFKAKGDYDSAEPLYRRALEAFERTLGPEHPDTLRSLNNLALLLSAKGDYASTEPLCRRAWEAQERTLGSEHPATLASLSNLAFLLCSKGDGESAEPLWRRAWEARERTLGPEHPDTLESLHGLAVLLYSKGDCESAELLFRRALEARERTLGLEHPVTLASLSTLALLLKDKGDYASAEPLCRRALDALERTLGPEHPTTIITRQTWEEIRGQKEG